MEQKGPVLLIDFLDVRNIQEHARQGLSLKRVLKQEEFLYSLSLKSVKEVQMSAELEKDNPQLKQQILIAIEEM